MRNPFKGVLFQYLVSLSRAGKTRLLLALDVLILPLAFFCALALSGPAIEAFTTGSQGWILFGAIWAFGAITSLALGLPRVKLNAYEQIAIMKTGVFAAIVAFVGIAVGLALGSTLFPATTALIFWMILTIAQVSSRLLAREFVVSIYKSGKTRGRVLIYGAGQTGGQLALALWSDPALEPVAFVDDNKSLQRMQVAGLKVYAPSRLPSLVKDMQIDRIVLAMPSLERPRQTAIARRLMHLGVDVRMMPSFSRLVGESDLMSSIEPVDPNNLLNRPGRQFDRQRMEADYRGQTIMVTGAGGSIGSELCRQLIACGPARLILFEISEAALYQIDRELREILADRVKTVSQVELIPVLGSVTDRSALTRVIRENAVSTVFHAAAYKHVPLVELNPLAALRNNAWGTRVLAEVARAENVSQFVLVSTDKAVRPANVMGATKRLAELVVQDLAARPDGVRFAIVRFGNVLGSSGSVVPLFKDQISRGGPVTVTHAEVTRYFMTVSEAAHLVLLSGTYASDGEIFVLDMGKPVRIADLARQMIEASGYSVRDTANPDGDIEIRITGLRSGEKLHEELLHGSDIVATENSRILRAREPMLSEIEVASALRDVERVLSDGEPNAALDALRRWIDGFDERFTAAQVLKAESRGGSDVEHSAR